MKRPDEVHAMVASELTGEALLAEVNRRLKDGDITSDEIEFRDDELAVGGGMALPEDDDGIDDWNALDEARVRFARKDYPETLYQLEKALGRDFSGLGDLVLGRSS